MQQRALIWYDDFTTAYGVMPVRSNDTIVCFCLEEDQALASECTWSSWYLLSQGSDLKHLWKFLMSKLTTETRNDICFRCYSNRTENVSTQHKNKTKNNTIGCSVGLRLVYDCGLVVYSPQHGRMFITSFLFASVDTLNISQVPIRSRRLCVSTLWATRTKEQVLLIKPVENLAM